MDVIGHVTVGQVNFQSSLRIACAQNNAVAQIWLLKYILLKLLKSHFLVASFLAPWERNWPHIQGAAKVFPKNF